MDTIGKTHKFRETLLQKGYPETFVQDYISDAESQGLIAPYSLSELLEDFEDNFVPVLMKDIKDGSYLITEDRFQTAAETVIEQFRYMLCHVSMYSDTIGIKVIATREDAEMGVERVTKCTSLMYRKDNGHFTLRTATVIPEQRDLDPQ